MVAQEKIQRDSFQQPDFGSILRTTTSVSAKGRKERIKGDEGIPALAPLHAGAGGDGRFPEV